VAVFAQWKALARWCLDTRYLRQVTDAALRAHSRYLLVRLDQQDAARAQSHTLTRLIHRAQSTRFGRDHDFRRIRTEADFRRLAPLSTPAELFRDCWQPALPNLGNASWPGPATLTGPPNRPLPLTPALLDCSRQVLRTLLALVVEARPAARLTSGQLLLLGDDLALAPPAAAEPPEVRDGGGCPGLPNLIRPYSVLAPGLKAGSAEPGPLLDRVAEQALRRTVTCILGPGERIAQLFDRVKDLTKRDRIADVWPNLAAVFCSRRSGEAAAGRLREEVGPRTLVLQTDFRPEGAVAVEDPRHGLPRLLAGHGLYFEFVPAEQAGHPRPERFGLDQVEPGVAYEAAVSTPAGLWACRIGCTVRFERLDPPLLRFVEAGRLQPARRTDLAPVTIPLQPPHPQSAGSRAAPPGTFVHSPWSARADRG
jgi:hypothetical protein